MKKISQKINNIFILYLLSSIFVISFHFVIRDSLFFLTKIKYILYYLYFTSFLILILFLFYFKLFVKKEIFFEVYLKFALFLFIINFFRSIYFFFENYIDSVLIETLIFIISIVFSVYILSKIFFKKILISKIYFFVKVFSYLIFSILLINFFNSAYNKNFAVLSNIKENRNPVVVIIIDGLPKSFIKNYTNNEKDINIIDANIRHDYVVQNYHKYITPNPWTCGFFSNLYGLSSKDSFRRDQKFKKILSNKVSPEKNFFHELDNLNITYTWAVSHSCAVPEGSAAAISDYEGFKSILNFSKLMIIYLEKIGLPSHTIINMKMFKGEPVAVHLKDQSFIKKILDIFSDSDDFNFNSHVLNTLKSSNKDFYIIHLNYGQWKDPELKDFKKPIDSLLIEVNNFFKIIREDSSFDNFNFIITADHGFSFHKEDFGYGISHRLEVLETPFILIKRNNKKNLKLITSHDNFRPCTVIDFQKSLLMFFKEKKELFTVNCSNTPKTSFSYPDDKNKVWLLTVFEKDNIYTYDFYDQYFNDKNNNISKYKKQENLLKFLEMYSIKY